MAYGLAIQNGTEIDGTGAQRVRADVAIANGKIAEIGKVSEFAKRTIDAPDLIVAPGFIDPHTHYDAQICWDPLVSCTSWHGLTSVVMGNCGVGIAPCKPEVHEVAAWDLVNVRAIPYDALNRGITWDWTTFPDFMNAAPRRGSGINLAFMAPLTPFRHYVMGEESIEREASAEETSRIKALIKEAVEAGAFGWSTTTLPQHIGYQGRPLASRDELKAYAGALRELGKGVIEVALTKSPGRVFEDEEALFGFLINERARPVTWLGMSSNAKDPQATADTMRRLEPLIRRGGVPQVLPKPFVVQIDLRNPFWFADTETWNCVFNRPPEEQKKIYRDMGWRNRWREETKQPHIFSGRWHRVIVLEAASPALKSLERKAVAEIAERRGADPLDTFLDLAIEDDLSIQYTMEQFHEDGIEQLIKDDRTMIGLSDGGAHVNMLCDAGYCTYLRGHWVREKQALMLERGEQRLTAEPADFFGITDRGRPKKDFAADITIFDPATVGSARRTQMRDDLPGGGRRRGDAATGNRIQRRERTAIIRARQALRRLAGTVLRYTRTD